MDRVNWLWWKYFLFHLENFFWMNKNRRLSLLATIFVALSYGTLAQPVAYLVAEATSEIAMGLTLTISSLAALPGYFLGGCLNNQWGCKNTSLLVLPINFLIQLMLALLGSQWLPSLWVAYSFFNGIIFIAVDGVFRQSVQEDSFETIRLPCPESKGYRFLSAYSIKSLFTTIATGLIAPVSFMLAITNYTWWLLTTLILTGTGWVLVWKVKLQQTSVPKTAKKEIEKPPMKVRFSLYWTALPYLGIAVCITAFSTFLPRDIGPSMAGIIFLVNKVTNGIALLNSKKWITDKKAPLVFRRAVLALALGVLLIPSAQLLGGGWTSLPILLISAVFIGTATGFTKLSYQLSLQNSAAEHQKGSAMAPLAMVAELGYVLTPIALAPLISLWGGYLLVWVISGIAPLMSLARTRTR